MPLQFLDAAIAIFFVKVNNNFRVRRGAKLMALGDEEQSAVPRNCSTRRCT